MLIKLTMLRISITLFAAFLSGFMYAQKFVYPSVNANGKSINDFIPNGWTILQSATGDLNNDKQDDIAFVLQHKDSVTIVNYSADNDPDFNDTVIYQPRILVITFYENATRQYRKIEQSDSFILSHDDPRMEEPFQDISIVNQVLQINFHIWYSMGSWSMSNNSYKFRFQNNEFRLIGADYNSTHRASGETEDRSYNFLTKKVRIAKGTISSDNEKVTWGTFQLKQLKTFKTFSRPFTWKVESDFYI